MSEYLVFISAENQRGLSQEEEQECLTAYGKWAETLHEKHILARRLSMTPGELLPIRKSVVTDGPFAEAKELIAGIILIHAETLDEAKEIAKSCPLRDYFQLFVKEVNQ